jgi:hypothetical protein
MKGRKDLDLKKSLYRIIEDTDWENEFLRKEEKINAACWAVIALAAFFFALALAQIVMR